MIMVMLFLMLLILTLVVYIHIRNNKVFDFRVRVINHVHDYYQVHGKKMEPDLYEKLPTYEEMVFSLKPLRMESYFTHEEIEKLPSTQWKSKSYPKVQN